MANTPINTDTLSAAIKAAIVFNGMDETDFKKFTKAFADYMVDNINTHTLDRLNKLETDYDTLLTGLTILATTLAAIPITSAAGTALGTVMSTQATQVSTRAELKAAQEADTLHTPGFGK